MSKDKLSYVCQRAAHAIIAEIGPIRVSTDALTAINQFLDEFIALLVTTASSFDLLRLKTTIIQLLPHSLGKNALVEAEIELKQQIGSDNTDFSSYEKMRSLGQNGPFPLERVIPLIQEACVNFCTLNNINKMLDKESKSKMPKSRYPDITLAPIVIIYLATIIEHVAEYILNSAAMIADQIDAEHIRVKEVLMTLQDDPQISPIFRRMNLRDQLEKRASIFPNYGSPTMPLPISNASIAKRDQDQHASYMNGLPQTSPDSSSLTDEDEDCDNTLSTHSMKSNESLDDRPLSILSNGTIKSAGSKSRFNFFGLKDKRGSLSFNFSNAKQPLSPTITSPISPSFSTGTNFDDLIRSGDTKKVSLTPNRLKTIEVKKESHKREMATWGKFAPPKEYNVHHAPTPTTTTSSPSPSSSSPITTATSPRIKHDSIIKATNTTTSLPSASSPIPRLSQRSRRSVMYDNKSDKDSRSSLKSTSTQEDDASSIKQQNNTPISNNKRNMHESDKTNLVKPRFELPSSIVAKRASMGSRPPSFHEAGLISLGHDYNNNSANNSSSNLAEMTPSNKMYESIRQQYENKRASMIDMHNTLPHQKKKAQSNRIIEEKSEQEIKSSRQTDMVYMTPATATHSERRSRKPRPISRGCQTEVPYPEAIIQMEEDKEEDDKEDKEDKKEDDDDEEWFIKEEEWNDTIDDEVLIVEWLLGNA